MEKNNYFLGVNKYLGFCFGMVYCLFVVIWFGIKIFFIFFDCFYLVNGFLNWSFKVVSYGVLGY